MLQPCYGAGRRPADWRGHCSWPKPTARARDDDDLILAARRRSFRTVPRICHVNFPAMSRIVKETCREFGVRYSEHESFGAGVASHYRWLRQLGAPDGSATAATA